MGGLEIILIPVLALAVIAINMKKEDGNKHEPNKGSFISHNAMIDGTMENDMYYK